MKHSLLYLFSAVCASALVLASCGKDEKPIVFPDEQGNVSGEISSDSKSLSFNAEAAWQLTVENGVWLKFIDADATSSLRFPESPVTRL